MNNQKKKIIFVLGGIFSGIGKGIIASSIGNLLQNNKLDVSMLKLDPYLNVDARFINPTEHGETSITLDGLECDIDIAHYERFLDKNLTKNSCITSGIIFKELIEKERQNYFNGRTIDFFDVSVEIKNKIDNLFKKENSDILVVEIGGNISDYNVKPFLDAINKIEQDNSFETIVCFLSYVTQFRNNDEFKTRATQKSIEMLNCHSIKPTFLMLRSFNKLTKKVIDKISKLSNFKKENIIEVPNKIIYEVPSLLNKNLFFDKLLNKLNIKKNLDMSFWDNFLKMIKKTEKSNKETLKIGFVSKYKNFKESYYSIIESLNYSSYILNRKFKVFEINPQELEKTNDFSICKNFDGIILPGGFGTKGTSGKILIAKYARENKIPLLGICYGMQLSMIEYFRNVLGEKNTNSKEISKSKNDLLIIDYIKDDKKMILGGVKISAVKNSLFEKCYKNSNWDLNNIFERHRHRFGPIKKYMELLKNDKNFHISGYSDNKNKISAFELKNHPFFLCVQFHPELNTKLNKPHPLLFSFFKKTEEKKDKLNK